MTLMKKIILFILFLLSGLSLMAQSSEPFPRPSFELGVGIQLENFKGNLYDSYVGQMVPVNQISYAYAIMGSLNIPIKMVRENLYIGINPNLDIAYSYKSIQTDIPVYLTLKYGAGSTKNAESRFGFGLGAGGYFSAFSTYLTSFYSGYAFNYSSIYITPSAMGEFTFRTNNTGIYQIRFDFTPVSVEKTSGNFTGNIGQFNIRLVRPF